MVKELWVKRDDKSEQFDVSGPCAEGSVEAKPTLDGRAFWGGEVEALHLEPDGEALEDDGVEIIEHRSQLDKEADDHAELKRDGTREP